MPIAAALFANLNIPSEIDLFSLDIDQDTHHIWAALHNFRPKVVVGEYNAALPPAVEWIHPYNPGRVWDGTHGFGEQASKLSNCWDGVTAIASLVVTW